MPVQPSLPAAPAPAPSRRRTVPLAAGRRRRDAPIPESDDATAGGDPGLGALIVFTAAVLVVVVAVVAVGAVDRWWVLVPVMLADFAVTFGVIFTINRLLRDDGDAPA